MLADVHLFLFFTKGMSLEGWARGGLIGRETAIYHTLLPRLAGITFITYGGRRDLGLADQLGGIDLICNRWNLPPALYVRLLPTLCRSHRRGRPLVKNNQTVGGDIALAVARRLGAPFLARCGYPHAEFAERLHAAGADAIGEARALERRVFTGADHVAVTTEAMRRQAMVDHGLPADRISVVPNYVRTDLFAPAPDIAPVPRRLVFVGRLEPQKNIAALLDAMLGLDLELLVIGEGSLRPALERTAATRGQRVTFLGNLPHDRLPGVLRTAELFVFPSLFEGHPKALLEAMACGLPVLAGDSPGVAEAVSHGQTGWLCGTTTPELREALLHLTGDPELRAALGQGARTAALGTVALDQVADIEAGLLARLAANRSGRS